MMRILFFISIMLFSAISAAANPNVIPVSPDDFFNRLESLQADFEQQVTDPNGKVIQQSSGQLWMHKPGRFRWQYLLPYEQLIVSNSVLLWVYEPDLEQATVRPLDSSMSQTPAVLLSGNQPLSESFDIVFSGHHDNSDYFHLTPKKQDSGYSGIIMVMQGSLLQRMELEDDLGQVTRFIFKNMKTNISIAANMFTFVAPAGVDVIGDDGR